MRSGRVRPTEVKELPRWLPCRPHKARGKHSLDTCSYLRVCAVAIPHEVVLEVMVARVLDAQGASGHVDGKVRFLHLFSVVTNKDDSEMESRT